MTLITGTQIKAARAYLEWSQQSLADAAGVSVSTVFAFEDGLAIRYSNLSLIRDCLEHAGLEFTAGEGVKRRDKGIAIFRGPDSRNLFFQDMLQTIHRQGGEISCSVRSRELFVELLSQKAGDDLAQLRAIGSSAKFKCLVSAVPTSDTSLPFVHFRSTSFHHTSPQTLFIYGSKWANVVKDDDGNFLFVVVDMLSAAQSHRSHFLAVWMGAIPIVTEAQGQTSRSSLA